MYVHPPTVNPSNTCFNSHIKPNTLSYYLYYGKARIIDPQILSNYDIVFTSFQTVTQEWKAAQNPSHSSPLHLINWFRLILDEGMIKKRLG